MGAPGLVCFIQWEGVIPDRGRFGMPGPNRRCDRSTGTGRQVARTSVGGRRGSWFRSRSGVSCLVVGRKYRARPAGWFAENTENLPLNWDAALPLDLRRGAGPLMGKCVRFRAVARPSRRVVPLPGTTGRCPLLARPPARPRSVARVQVHVQLLADEQTWVGTIHRVNDLQHPRVHALGPEPGQ